MQTDRPASRRTSILRWPRRVGECLPRLSARAPVIALCWLILTAGAGSEAPPVKFKEYQIKAAFLFNFSKFVEWPARKFADGTSPMVIGILGENPFGNELEKVIKGRHINGREMVVQHFDTAEAARSAHLLFVSAASEPPMSRLTSALDGAGVLTVGESENFARRGGVITFILEGDKLGFEINLESAERAGLKVSSQLQKLAKMRRP